MVWKEWNVSVCMDENCEQGYIKAFNFWSVQPILGLNVFISHSKLLVEGLLLRAFVVAILSIIIDARKIDI